VDLPKLLDSAGTLIDKLSLKRIAMIFLLMLIAGAGMVGWLDRDYISGLVRPSKIAPEKQELIVSDSGKAAIDETLKKGSYIINTIFVVQMNMERNSRRIIYFKSLDLEIQRQQEEFVRTHATPDVAVFNDDPINNKRIIGYINGEFICTDFKVTASARYLTNVDVKTVCATAVPPIYGKFRGTVVAFVKGIPNAEEQTQLKILLRDLSDRLDNPSSSK